MFSFGIFTSHLPYILMVSVYLAFFLNSSLFNKDVESDTKDSKEIKLERSSKNSKHNSVHFFGYQKQIAAKHKETERFFNLLPRINQSILYYQEPFILFVTFFSLFNRPPPIHS